MSGTDNSNEGSNFVEFRRKVEHLKYFPQRWSNLLRTLNFGGPISMVVHGRVLKSGYEQGFFGNARLDQCWQAALRRRYRQNRKASLARVRNN